MKIVGSIFVTAGICFAGFIILFITAFMGKVQFYPAFIITSGVLLIIFSNLAIWGQSRKRWFRIGLLSFMALSLISAGVFEFNEKQIRDRKILSKQDVDLREYQPFLPNSKAVKLEEEATLKLMAPLPKLDGSTALYPIYAAFVQAVYPEGTYHPYDKSQNNAEVVSTQTAHAYERLLSGETDLIFVPQPSKKYLELAEKSGKELAMTPIGKEAFVFFVHADNPVQSLTIEQIQGIYSGEITNWQQVGGLNEEIAAYQRPEESGSQQALIRFMGNKQIMQPKTERMAGGMGEIINRTAEYQNKKNAIGYSFRFFSEEMAANGKIRNVAVNGVVPSQATIQDGTYPITMEINAVTAGTTNENVAPFIDWILSEQGQKIIEETGYVRINTQK